MKILVIDEAFTENIGDKAIEFCMKNLLQYKYPDADISFQSYRGKYIPSEKNELQVKKIVRPFFRKIKHILPIKLILRTQWFFQNFEELILKHRNIKYDLTVIGGGPLIDGYWMYPFAFWLWVRRIKAKKTILLGMGYGYDLSVFDKKMVKNALKSVDEVYLRDVSSIKRFQDDFGFSCKFMPDVAFTISKFMPASSKISKRITFFPIGYEFYKNQMSGLETILLANDYDDFLLKTVQAWHLKGYSICLSASQISQDFMVLEKLHNELIKLQIEVEVNIPKNLEALVEIISSSENIFSGRMHPLILGYSYSKECIVYPRTRKLSNFDEEIVKPKKSLAQITDSIFQTFDKLA